MQTTYCTERATTLLVIMAGLQLALFLAYFPFAIIVTPYGDVLDWLSRFYTLDESLWQYLWAPHNGHRLVFSKLLTIGDAEVFGGLSYPTAVVCVSLLLVAAAITLSGIRRSVSNRDTRRWVTAVTVLLLFPTSSLVNYAYPVNSQHIIVSFFAFLACVLMARAASAAGGMPLKHNVHFAMSLIAALCASLSSLNGLLVWPILAWMAWRLRFGRAYLSAIIVTGAMISIGFGYHYSLPGEKGSSINSLGDIAHLVKYLIEYHGMPWVEVGALYWPAMALGFTVLSLSIIYIAKMTWSPRARSPTAVVAAALLMFSLGTAVMIAIGRHKLGLLPAHRYGIFVLITFAALFVLNIHMFERWMETTRGRALVVWGTLVLAFGYLGQQVWVGQFAVHRAAAFAQYEKQILAGEFDPLATEAIYLSRVEDLKQHYRLLKKQEIYMFRRRRE